MSYIPSVNIELNAVSDFRYIVTENARMVAGNIVNSLDKNIIDRQSNLIIKAFRKESKNEKNGLSKCRKSS